MYCVLLLYFAPLLDKLDVIACAIVVLFLYTLFSPMYIMAPIATPQPPPYPKISGVLLHAPPPWPECQSAPVRRSLPLRGWCADPCLSVSVRAPPSWHTSLSASVGLSVPLPCPSVSIVPLQSPRIHPSYSAQFAQIHTIRVPLCAPPYTSVRLHTLISVFVVSTHIPPVASAPVVHCSSPVSSSSVSFHT